MEVQSRPAEKRILEALSRISSAVDFRRVASETLRSDGEVVVSGLTGTARALFIAGLWQTLRRPLIVVTPHDKNVSTLASDIEYFHRVLNASAAGQVCAFPANKVEFCFVDVLKSQHI